jgi:superfamily I DNA and/or RNA helicase
MHPEVARFANETFYEGILDPVPLPHQKRTLQFEIVDADNPFQKALSTHRLLFIPSYQPKERVLPKANLVEAELIAETVKAVYDLYCQNNMKFEPNETIGVIVPYRHQIALVRNLLLQNRVEALGEITIDTVERFQGSQRNVIIFGFTVQMPYQLDFLCAQTFCENGIEIDRKLNVAMTRAKEQLVLIGNPSLLKENPVFRKLLRFVKTMTLNLALSD